MYSALLIDLDDTLLVNPMESFIPAYFTALTEFFEPVLPPDRLVSALMAGMKAMSANDGKGATNEETFAGVFYPAAGISREILQPMFQDFYENAFSRLKSLTRPAPDAGGFIGWAFKSFHQVVIATNPVFPRTAVDQRLGWAGLSPSDFDYTLITTLEDMHSLKPHPAYFKEILDILERSPEECLMVGDDWKRDILPAHSLGIETFWISPDGGELPPDPNLPLLGRGSLGDLWKKLREVI